MWYYRERERETVSFLLVACPSGEFLRILLCMQMRLSYALDYSTLLCSFGEYRNVILSSASLGGRGVKCSSTLKEHTVSILCREYESCFLFLFDIREWIGLDRTKYATLSIQVVWMGGESAVPKELMSLRTGWINTSSKFNFRMPFPCLEAIKLIHDSGER